MLRLSFRGKSLLREHKQTISETIISYPPKVRLNCPIMPRISMHKPLEKCDCDGLLLLPIESRVFR